MRRVNIDVAVRIRPTSDPHHLLTYTDHDVTVRNSRHYQFSRVLPPQCSQAEVFERCRLDSVVEHVLEGYNATVLAFGQTGAGKTYTMEGADIRKGPTSDSVASNTLEGIVPRSIRALFERLGDRPRFRVSCSFLQIYNERIYDLFSAAVANPFSATNRDFASTTRTGLKLRWDRSNEFSVENLQTKWCATHDQMLKVWQDGLKNRVVAATRLNLLSSRSHTIFTVRLHPLSEEPTTEGLYSRLEFVDLAGSERILGDGKQLRESIDINKSLFTLRKVINSLECRQNFIPYRESKLTSLLKQSFGGSCYCLFVACINPADSCLEESAVTLDYTTKASAIENHVERRSDKRDIVIEELKRENDALRAELASCYKQIEVLGRLNFQGGGSANAHVTGSPANSQSNVPSFTKVSQPLPPLAGRTPTNAISPPTNLNNISVALPPKEESPVTQFADRGSFARYKEQVRIDYEYFGERLVESINTVRQLLKSNKKLREELDMERAKCEQLGHEVEELLEENERHASRHEATLETHVNPRAYQSTERTKSYQKVGNFKTRNLRLLTQHSREGG